MATDSDTRSDSVGQGHTPGPWEVRSGERRADSAIWPVGRYQTTPIVRADGFQRSWAQARTCDETDANVRLIAAAPDLLAVAEEMLPQNLCLTNANVPDSTVVPLDVTMGELRRIAAAVAKARGVS